MNEQNNNTRKYLFTAVYGNYILQMFELSCDFGYVIYFHKEDSFNHIDTKWGFRSVRDAISYGMIKMHISNSEDGLNGFYSVTFLD